MAKTIYVGLEHADEGELAAMVASGMVRHWNGVVEQGKAFFAVSIRHPRAIAAIDANPKLVRMPSHVQMSAVTSEHLSILPPLIRAAAADANVATGLDLAVAVQNLYGDISAHLYPDL